MYGAGKMLPLWNRATLDMPKKSQQKRRKPLRILVQGPEKGKAFIYLFVLFVKRNVGRGRANWYQNRRGRKEIIDMCYDSNRELVLYAA